ncbi:ribbon-helix-helix protein, CopG family [candidate division WOR-3 bacterium]|nr:ribbon-helix-helix protein, CopG family [candidate division WOR-3 bacterium]
MGKTVSVRLPEKMDKDLDGLSRETGISKSDLVKEALRGYLNETRGYYIALKRLHNDDDKLHTTEEMKKLLGFD